MLSDLLLPEGHEAQVAMGSPRGLALEPDEIVVRLRAALDDLPRDLVIARQAALAVMRFAAPQPTLIDLFASRVARHFADGRSPSAALDTALPAAFYDCAAVAVAEGHVAEAGIGLAALLARIETRPAGLLGLAVCAARLSLFDDALVLALESRLAGNPHPRADYVAGLAELERGNRRAARLCLARSSRLARRAARHGEDLRMAQRLLLLMNLNDAESLRKVLSRS